MTAPRQTSGQSLVGSGRWSLIALLLGDVTIFTGLLTLAAAVVLFGSLVFGSASDGETVTPFTWPILLAQWLPPLPHKPHFGVAALLAVLPVWVSYLWVARGVGGRTLGQWIGFTGFAQDTQGSGRVGGLLLFLGCSLLTLLGLPRFALLIVFVSSRDVWKWATNNIGWTTTTAVFVAVIALLVWGIAQALRNPSQMSHWVSFGAYGPVNRSGREQGIGALLMSVFAVGFVLLLSCQWLLFLVTYMNR